MVYFFFIYLFFMLEQVIYWILNFLSKEAAIPITALS